MLNHIFAADRVRLPDGREGVASKVGRVWIHVMGDDGRKSRHPVTGSDLQSLAPQVTLREENRLYVIRNSHGYSCLGWDVCEARLNGYVMFLQREGLEFKRNPRAILGTLAHYADYAAAGAAIKRHYDATGRRCDSELQPQLVGLEGKRVEVVDRYGETRRFIVGRSTGWIPCHLEIASRSSHGGGPAFGGPYSSVRVVA